jgi:hypothetical protein
MLNFVNGGMVPSILQQHVGFILNYQFDMKMLPLELEVSLSLQNFT